MNSKCRAAFNWLAVTCGIVVIVAFLYPSVGTPWTIQRLKQRKMISERVQQAGGWSVLRKECGTSFSGVTTNFIRWRKGVDAETNLPPTLAKLRPLEVRVYADPDGRVIARIKFYGAWSTGGRGIPYYGIWVVCSPTPNDFTPKLDFGGNTVKGVIKKITNSIFEVY